MERGKVPVFLRSKDWRPEAKKLCLRSLDRNVDGWRKFRVCPEWPQVKKQKVDIKEENEGDLHEIVTATVMSSVPSIVSFILQRLSKKCD